jgi:SAM-dependent methyltransferase
MTKCKICDNSFGNKTHVAREMMFGFRDEFEYIECTSCGCLQIKEIPKDLSKYYPVNYYSYQTKKNPKKNPIQTFLRRHRSKYCLFGNNKLWPLRSKKYASFNWFKKTKVQFDSSILDVGCGAGKLLIRMQRDGFFNLTGVDPYIEESIYYRNGVKILKIHIAELQGKFDLIMSHHSFEHMPQPIKVLKKFYELLKSNRYVLIRIPVASSYAWRHYGVHWVALDAPRHLFLHTVESIDLLAKQAGFKVADLEFDSTALQFVGSELYLRDIPLKDGICDSQNPQSSIFSAEQLQDFKTTALKLNKTHDGDQACFYLYKE